MAVAETEKFTVKGFHCSGCSNNVGSALSNLDGVIKAQAEFETGLVEVRFDPDRWSVEELAEEIRALGFEPV